MSERLRWFLPHHPDVLGLLGKQADVTSRGIAAFARCRRKGDKRSPASLQVASAARARPMLSFSFAISRAGQAS